ncbi:hypothetical protein [Crateriforma conspicua]|uniref:Uncharacterized protein n=1 Tax=Crateriforma conspicua TaxID=2527996 RepID=A0A5C6FMP4_9PLAN|nr:hypothetical protein [Crateriforma conspicua]TWU61109.1 hypothetical protein V7x_54210 [Crateriforma conspicua]
MGLPGPTELLVIAAILLVLVGIPVAIIILAILFVQRAGRSRSQDDEHHE